MLFPNANENGQDMLIGTVTARTECIRETRYADKQRKLWMQAQTFANEQNAAVMRRACGKSA